MAFYKVTLDKKLYVNQQLCRAVLRLGDTGIIDAVGNGTIEQVPLFGQMLYSVGDKQKADYKAYDDQAIAQNLDADVLKLQRSEPDDYVQIKIPKSSKIEVFGFRGMGFVKMVDVPYPYKYRYQHRMATLRLFGFVFVALGAKVKDQKKPVIVTIKD